MGDATISQGLRTAILLRHWEANSLSERSMNALLSIFLGLAITTSLPGQTKKVKGGSKPPVETATGDEEPDNRPPLLKYKGNCYFATEAGKLTVQLAKLKGFTRDGDTDYLKHISESKIKCKKSFDDALKTVKKQKAKEALKNFHVAFLSALQGLAPGDEELVRDYQRRQQALEEKMNEAWARFEIEE